MAGDIKNPDNEKFDKIKSLKKKGLLNKKDKIIKPIELKEKNIRDDMRKDTAQELPRGLQIDTTTSSYGDSGKKRTVPKFKGGGRAGYKSGMGVCKLAKRGKGRAYGKNS
jgi:hypothetical protein